MSIKRLISCIFVAMFIFSALLALLVYELHVNQEKLQQSHLNRYQSYLLADELRQSSDDLTRLVRSYVTSGDKRFKKYYMDVLAIRNGEKPRPSQYNRIYWDLLISQGTKPRPDELAHSLQSLMVTAGFSDQELALLKLSQDSSDALVQIELKAMYALEGYYIDRNKEFTRRGAANKEMAQTLLFSDKYHEEKAKIMRPVDQFFTLLDQRTQHDTKYYYNQENLIYLQLQCLTAFIILFSILLCFALLKFVLKPLGGEPNELRKIANNIIAGNLDMPFKEQSRGVYLSLEKMTANLKQHLSDNDNRAWLQQGQVSIDHVMRSEQQEDRLSELVLTTLARYVDAQIGALYIWRDAVLDNGEGVLQQSAVFGQLSSDFSATQYRLHQGLIGQAAVEQHQIIVQDVPSDYTHILSATGTSEAKQIVLIPFSYRGQLKGLIELAFLQPIDQLKQNLLESLKESIGITFENINARVSLNEALEEAQNLSEELQVQQEELRMSNESLRSKSSDLEEQQIILQESKHEIEQKAHQLEQSNKYKSEFLANMSHELRTPLNSLLILAGSLSNNSSGNLSSEEAYSAQVIEDSGRHLLHLINHILDLSKIEAGHMQTYCEPINLQHLHKQLVDRFNVLAKEQQIEFVFTIPSHIPKVIFSDKLRLEQILMNLISNAIKFTEKGAVNVSIDIDTANDTILFVIKDSGIGIKSEQHQNIFEAFQQADGSMTRKYGGTGLGLSISKDLAKLLNGQILLESELHKGSTFTLQLPLQLTGSDLEALPMEQHSTSLSAALSTPSTHSIANTASTSKLSLAPSIAASSNKNILIVEDDAANRLAFEVLLQFDGVHCDYVASGQAALEYMQKTDYLAVILDLNLPDISGFDVLDAFKSIEHNQQPEFIVYTARELSDGELLKLNQFTDKIIVKSTLSEERLVEELREIISDTLDASVISKESVSDKEEIDISALKGKRILLVDDDMRNTFSLAKILRANDIVIDIATSGSQGLAALKNNPSIDIVILDIMMPGIDGLETTAKIREQPQFKHLPIIAFTASVMPNEKEKCLAAGADDFLTKPVDLDLLYKSLLSCI